MKESAGERCIQFPLDEILIQLKPATFIPRPPLYPVHRMRFEAKINKRDCENERLKRLGNNGFAVPIDV